MRQIWVILIVLFGSCSVRAEGDVFWKWFSPGLQALEERRTKIDRELEELGAPMVGQTVAELGYQNLRMKAAPLVSPWVQIDLRRSRDIDSVTLVPALVDWQSAEERAYGFPLRFRIDVSDDPGFRKFSAAGGITEQDAPNPGAAPVTINTRGLKGRYVRVTFTKLAEDNHQFFAALSEIMVLSSNLNVALGCPVSAPGSVEIPPRWSITNLVDGRTPLGPPIRQDLLPWDGIYSGPSAGALPWIQLDLGGVFPLQELRLHPVHARFGADVPGFSFPKAFRLEAASSADFSNSVVLFEATNYSNPGNNPVTIQATNLAAQFLRITSMDKNAQGELRFGLSEIEVYSGDHNVARSAAISRIGDRGDRSSRWPVSAMVDGYTSYGQLLELPDWIRTWERRRALHSELKRIDRLQAERVVQTQRRVIRSGIGFAAAGVLGVFALTIFLRYRRRRELHELRLRLARDIHDEIGSNLAGIAMLSEVAGGTVPSNVLQQEDWHEVNRIAQETLGAMREVLWLIGGREDSGLNLMTHLQLAASRILAGKRVIWKSTVDHFPPEWPLEARRQVFLIFKEALTNIIRHAHATQVEIAARIAEGRFQLSIADDGGGFDPARITPGIGLTSQQMRIRTIGGTLQIKSAPGKGTLVLLAAPFDKISRHLPFLARVRNHNS